MPLGQRIEVGGQLIANDECAGTAFARDDVATLDQLIEGGASYTGEGRCLGNGEAMLENRLFVVLGHCRAPVFSYWSARIGADADTNNMHQVGGCERSKFVEFAALD